MMAAMAEENGEGRAEASPSRGGAKAASARRIKSAAISWSSRERTRKLSLRWLTCTAVAWIVVGFGMGAKLDSWLLTALFHLVRFSTSLSAIAILVGGRSREKAKAGFIDCRGDALVIEHDGTKQRIPLEDVRQGWIEDVFGDGDACDVVLRFRNGREVTVRVADRAAGESLLRVARAPSADRVLHFPLRGLAASFRYGEPMAVTGMLAIPPLLFIGGVYPLLPDLQHLVHASALDDLRVLAIPVGLLVALSASLLLALLGISRLLRWREVIVGADGVALEGFGKRRFIAYAEVRRIKRDPEGVRLHLKDGGSVLLPTIVDTKAPLPVTRGVDALFDPASVKRSFPGGIASEEVYEKDMARREALFDRIRLAMRGRGQSRVSSVQLAQLDRRRRSLPAWRDDLRALLAVEGSGYRGAALGPDQLAEVVEDAGASAERRVAAAIALSGSGDAESRRRVRIAVEACVDENLRAALAHAAEGEIEEAELRRAMKQRREALG
jgi:hypothetical protein